MPFSRIQVAAAIKKLGRQRLIEECERHIGQAPEGARWKTMTVIELSEHLVDRLKNGDAQELAAEGLARQQRAPPVGGPSWMYEGQDRLSAEVADRALQPLQRRLVTRWKEVTVDLQAHMMMHGVVYVTYSSYTLQTSGTELFQALSRNTAMILLDYVDQISTVSARVDKDALFIGAVWADAIGSTPHPVELTLTPSFEHERLSSATVKMLEAVYGRIAPEAAIINVDRIWTERKDPKAPVNEQWFRGHADHVLLDQDVRRSLGRGDDVTGIAFQIDWTYKGKRGELHYYSHVTILSQRGPLILRVTRAGHSFELASVLYQTIRRALLGDTSPHRLREVQRVIQEEIMVSAK